MVLEQEKSSYRNCHETILQNVLVACNFNLEFIYILSEWEGFAHNSKVLNDVLSINNGLKVSQAGCYANSFSFFFFTILIHFIIFTIYFLFFAR